MIVEVTDAIFVSSARDASIRRRLLTLIQLADEHEHAVVHEAGGDWKEAPGVQALLPCLAPDDPLWLAGVLDRGLQEQGRMDRRVRVEDRKDDWSQPVPRIGLATAADFVAAPLRVLVENELNDGLFLRCWASGQHANAFRRAWKKRLVDFENGGGNGTMKTLLEERLSFNRRKIHEGALVADSDRDEPGTLPGAVKDLQKQCERAWGDRPGRWHILQRRAIENYLPITVLGDQAPDKSAVVEAYARLPERLRHLYHLKEGLSKRLPEKDRGPARKLLPEKLSAEILDSVRRGAWAEVSEDAARVLFRGFDDGIASRCLGILERGGYTFDDDAQREAGVVIGALLRWL